MDKCIFFCKKSSQKVWQFQNFFYIKAIKYYSSVISWTHVMWSWQKKIVTTRLVVTTWQMWKLSVLKHEVLCCIHCLTMVCMKRLLDVLNYIVVHVFPLFVLDIVGDTSVCPYYGNKVDYSWVSSNRHM